MTWNFPSFTGLTPTDVPPGGYGLTEAPLLQQFQLDCGFRHPWKLIGGTFVAWDGPVSNLPHLDPDGLVDSTVADSDPDLVAVAVAFFVTTTVGYATCDADGVEEPPVMSVDVGVPIELRLRTDGRLFEDAFPDGYGSALICRTDTPVYDGDPGNDAVVALWEPHELDSLVFAAEDYAAGRVGLNMQIQVLAYDLLEPGEDAPGEVFIGDSLSGVRAMPQ